MSFKKISQNKEIEEARVQEKIYSLVNQKTDFIFNAGAGAGKTYSLIELLKYIIKKEVQSIF
ncbi:MAG: hypothetical protein HEEMFOPI_01968 [Holosporales bacterium]